VRYPSEAAERAAGNGGGFGEALATLHVEDMKYAVLAAGVQLVEVS
jgi:hypothetical protein